MDKTARSAPHDHADDWLGSDNLEREMGRGNPFVAAVRASRSPIIITDPRQPDNPIVFANDAFEALCGYTAEEVLGRNCRFLQGVDTDPDAVQQIRDAVRACRSIEIELFNYRKDGSTFWNSLQIDPVRNAAGDVSYFLASQLNVTERVAARRALNEHELLLEREVRRRTAEFEQALERQKILTNEVDHRVKNNLMLIGSLIRLQIRNADSEELRQSLDKLQGRIDSMASVHRQLYEMPEGEAFDIGTFTVAHARQTLSSFGRTDIDLQANVDSVVLEPAKAMPFALILNELFTNAVKHAFASRGGCLSIRLAGCGSAFRLTIADDGPGEDRNLPRGRSMGKALVTRLARQINAQVIWKQTPIGSEIVLSSGQEY